jgi:hypothetical protein
VHVLFDGGVEEGSVDVKLIYYKAHGGRNGEEESETVHTNDRRESYRIVKARALTTTLGREAGLEAGDFTPRLSLDLVDSHVVDDHATGGKFDEFQWGIGHEGGLLLLHRGLIFLRLMAGEGSTINLSLADRRAIASDAAPTAICGGSVIRLATFDSSRMFSLSLPC